MKIKFIHVLFCASILLLSLSCVVVHKGQMVSLDYGQPVPIQDQAIGSASVSYFWGFGGTRTDILLKTAKDNMIKNRPLNKNEEYKNINFNVSHSFYPLFSKLTYTVTADVINISQKSTYPIKNTDSTELFVFGDSLFNYKQEFLGFFIERQDNAEVKLQTPNGILKQIPEHDFYREIASFKNYQLGQHITFESDFFSEGTIKAFGYNRVLVDTKGDDSFEISYSAITSENEQLNDR